MKVSLFTVVLRRFGSHTASEPLDYFRGAKKAQGVARDKRWVCPQSIEVPRAHLVKLDDIWVVQEFHKAQAALELIMFFRILGSSCLS